MVISTTHFK